MGTRSNGDVAYVEWGAPVPTECIPNLYVEGGYLRLQLDIGDRFFGTRIALEDLAAALAPHLGATGERRKSGAEEMEAAWKRLEET